MICRDDTDCGKYRQSGEQFRIEGGSDDNWQCDPLSQAREPVAELH